MTLTELMDRAALLCGIASITGCLVICAIFSLYAIDDRDGTCHTDGCDQGGILPARTINGTIRVCHDCYTEGAALGAWVA